jgi:hypothetical protein
MKICNLILRKNNRKQFLLSRTKAICFMLLFSLLIDSQQLFSQEIATSELKINTGAVLTCFSHYNSSPFTIYLAPSFKNKRHEFYAGIQLTTLASHKTIKPLTGGIAGYKFYVFKNSTRFNMFLHYYLQYVHQTVKLYQLDSAGEFTGNYRTEKFNNPYNTFGIGFNAYLDKKRMFSFYSTMGYCIFLDWDKSHGKIDIEPVGNGFNFSLGVAYRFAVLKKK